MNDWETVSGPAHAGGLQRGSSPGWYVREFAADHNWPSTATKSHPTVTAFSLDQAKLLWDVSLAAPGTLQRELKKEVYCTRLLTRYAISEKPKARSVMDFAYCNNM